MHEYRTSVTHGRNLKVIMKVIRNDGERHDGLGKNDKKSNVLEFITCPSRLQGILRFETSNDKRYDRQQGRKANRLENHSTNTSIENYTEK